MTDWWLGGAGLVFVAWALVGLCRLLHEVMDDFGGEK